MNINEFMFAYCNYILGGALIIFLVVWFFAMKDVPKYWEKEREKKEGKLFSAFLAGAEWVDKNAPNEKIGINTAFNDYLVRLRKVEEEED
jgi:hypothetical protein